jgi:glutamate carboxypeptidase
VAKRYLPTLKWISSQEGAMLRRVSRWTSINSGTTNLAGLKELSKVLQRDFAVLDGRMRTHKLPPMVTIDRRAAEVHTPLGQAISIIKRPQAKRRVFLCIHMDTVYPADDPFQKVKKISGGKLHGPGVADAKGGLAVMLTALETLERSELAEEVGWEILINPDEEVGSPGSAQLLKAAAKRNHVGLLFEPSLADGALVDRRRGSGNFTVVIRGRSAHAGRDFASGRSAIVAAAELTLALHELNRTLPGVTINTGSIDGGGAPNVVPDLAISRINIRTSEASDELRVKEALDEILARLNAKEGISAQLHGGFSSPPKILDDRGRALLETVFECGRELGLELTSRSSGGASDGNKLSAAGLPNIDSLGVRGGEIHSPREFLVISSLVERAQLTALLLMKMAAGGCNFIDDGI